MTEPSTPAARAARTGTPGALPRPRDLRKSAPLMRIAMVLFTIGLVAILIDIALFASGSRNLPLWLNLTALLAPIGFGLGLVAMVLEARRPPSPR